MPEPGAVGAASAQNYPALLAEVKARIQAAQYAALRAVNKKLVGLYWDIGGLIVERQQTEGWGKGVVEQLSTDLRVTFPGVSGFSTQNLWYMRQFYQEYSAAPKLQPLVGEIGWAHNLLILSRCKDTQGREFYLRMTRKFGWSKNVLAHQIDNQSYEKSLLGQTNFDQTLTPALRAQAKLAVKDEYAFDFLELGEQHSERELERALIARIEDFLRAMGSMFAFMVRRTRTRPSALSCARRKPAPSLSTRCATRASPSAWRPTRSPKRCRRSLKTSCRRPKSFLAYWRAYETD